MKMHNISIIILMISLVTLSLVTYIEDVGEKYEKNIDFEDLNNTQNAFDNITSNVEKLQKEYNSIVNSDNAGEVLLIPYKLIKSGWTMAKLVVGPFFLMDGLLTDVANTADSSTFPFLTGQLKTAITSVIWILISSMIVYSFFKWKFET